MSREYAGHRELVAARDAIRRRFAADVRARASAGNLPAGYRAGGQFFENVEQRGLLGTLAAVRVLAADASPDGRQAVVELVAYLRSRRTLELEPGRHDQASRGRWQYKVSRDETMTVRQAELLFSLCLVPTGCAPTEDLRSAAARRLVSGRARDGSGWAHALGSPNGGTDLPTAHVIRALHRNGNDVTAESQQTLRGLVDRVRNPPHGDGATAHVDCFVALVLHEAGVLRGEEARNVLAYLFRELKESLNRRSAATEDAPLGGTNEYIGIPWQLHLIALTARISPWWRYPSPVVQRRLTDITRSVLGPDGFQYGGGGRQRVTSLRTYSYIDETVSTILESTPGSAIETSLARFLRAAERPTEFARRAASIVLLGLCLALTVAGILSWSGDLSELAPEFIGGAVAGGLGLALRLRRQR